MTYRVDFQKKLQESKQTRLATRNKRRKEAKERLERGESEKPARQTGLVVDLEQIVEDSREESKEESSRQESESSGRSQHKRVNGAINLDSLCSDEILMNFGGKVHE